MRRPRPILWVKRIWVSRLTFAPLTRMLVGSLLGLSTVVAGLYVATSINEGDWGVGLDLLMGTAPAFSTRSDAVAVPLAVVGYLLVPAIVGTSVALIIDARMKGMVLTDEQLAEKLAEQLERLGIHR